jgi:hypothetical protein
MVQWQKGRLCKSLPGEPYHLERGQVTLPYAIGMDKNMLFGDTFVDWRNKADTDIGDKLSWCLNYLNGLLPWLVEVSVQDSVFSNFFL